MSKKEEIIINAQKRTVTGKKVGALRRSGILPGVVYGRHIEAFPIQMDFRIASRTLAHATSSSLITIDVGDEKHSAILRDRQKDVINGQLLHVDFLAVSLTEKLRTQVQIELVGEAPVSEIADTVIIQGLNELEIECLPQDLPSTIQVDISSLVTLEDNILVKDIDIGKEVTILTDPEDVIVSVTYVAQEVEEEEEVEESILDLDEEGPEVVEKGKKSEEGEAEAE